MVRLYGLIIERILAKNPPESGEKGYYFALTHRIDWHEIADLVAPAMKSRGLVTDDKVRVWSDDKIASEALEVPAAFVPVLFKSR